MARVAFFTEKLPPDSDPVAHFAFDLIRSLADQGHEIRVYSTYRPGAELPPRHPRIEILRPFRAWGWLEVPRLIPLLFDFRPEVLHFIQPRGEALSGITNAMSALSGFGPVLGRPAIVSSFYDFHRRDLARHRFLIGASDVITVSNEPQARLMATPSARAQIEILPVPASSFREEIATTEPWPDSFGANRAIVFVPGDVSDHEDPARLFRELGRALSFQHHMAAALGGGWGRVPTRERHRLLHLLGDEDAQGRLLLTGPLDAATEYRAFGRAEMVFTASLPAESLGLARWLRSAIEAGTPVIMSEVQARIDPLRWQHEENALVASDREGGWSEALKTGPESALLLEKIRARLPEFARVETVDRPGNVVSRIYARLLDRKRSAERAHS